MSEGKTLSGHTLQEICRYWNSGDLKRRTLPIMARSGHDRVFIWNRTGDFLIAGSVVKASDMIVSNPTYEDAFLGYVNHGICIQGVKPTKDDDVVAIIDDDVAPNFCVSGVIPGVFACPVNMYSQADEYAEPNIACGCISLKSCSGGRYHIFAKSQSLSPTNVRFCFLQLVGGEGGHLIGALTSNLSAGGAATVTVYKDNVPVPMGELTCPLLKKGSVSSGTTVELAYDINRKIWYISNIACEEDLS